jgi:perosamine synthetase
MTTGPLAEKTQMRIAVAAPLLDGNERRYVDECLQTTWISSNGRFIGAFEQAFAEFCGVRHAIATCNGTAALHLALLALGLQPGDEVIVPTLTFIATANAVSYCGGRPVFVDSGRNTFNIDPAAIEAKIGPRTRGIVAVHLYGLPADMDPIRDIAQRHGLFLVEDAAEAHGATYGGGRAGNLSDCATFSFYGNKIITTGEGGMVTTNDDALAERLRHYRGQGMDPLRRYWFDVIGYNYRMTNIAAAIGLAQLERVDHHLRRRREVAALYDQSLAPLSNFVIRPVEPEGVQHAYWMYTVLLSDGVVASRDEVMAALDADGIETRPVFYPLHLLPPYHEAEGRYPNAEFCAARGISLPTHALLQASHIDRICYALARAVRC